MEHTATGAQTEPRFYSTGEAARECGVSVRTVQYYDKRGLVSPSGQTSGGRRLYCEEDLARLQIACFLRNLGLKVDAVGEILGEPNPGPVIGLLLDKQEAELRAQLREARGKLERTGELRRGLERMGEVSVESIGSVASMMETNPNLKKLHRSLVVAGLPVSALQWVALWAWIARGARWPAAVWAAVAVPYGIVASRTYYGKVAYVCPECHASFKPPFREAFFASHTPHTRRLTCPECGRTSHCVEVWGDAE